MHLLIKKNNKFELLETRNIEDIKNVIREYQGSKECTHSDEKELTTGFSLNDKDFWYVDIDTDFMSNYGMTFISVFSETTKYGVSFDYIGLISNFLREYCEGEKYGGNNNFDLDTVRHLLWRE